MFGSKVIVVPSGGYASRAEYVTRTVHEHRAPTDASVKLLKEMEDAAREKVEHSVNVGNNGFECVVTFHKDAMAMDTVAVALFSLNGKKMRAEARICGWDKVNTQSLVEKIKIAVSEKISSEILHNAFCAATWPTF